MPYHVYPDGRVDADSAEEVAALWLMLQGKSISSAAPTPEAAPTTATMPPTSADDCWSILMKSLDKPFHRDLKEFLSVIKKLGREIGRDDLRQQLGYASNMMIGARITTLIKNCKRAGLDVDTIVMRTKTTYRPGPLLRGHDLPWDAPTSPTPPA